jgi:hypothetical protein
VAVLSREEFDAIEFDAACSGDHQTAAKRMSRLAVTGIQTDSMPRSEAYLRAGEQWLLADDPAAAASGFRLAMADGGPVFVDPRVPLARALYQLGRPAEAQTLIEKLKAQGRTDPRTCDLVAELLVERADLAGALDWATTGVELCLARAAGTGRQGAGRQGAGRQGTGRQGTRRQGAGQQGTGQQGAGQQGAGQQGTGQQGAGPVRAERQPRSAGGPRAVSGLRSVPPRSSPGTADDGAELRMLLSLRYRIRNDLGLAEDSYDKLLDEA